LHAHDYLLSPTQLGEEPLLNKSFLLSKSSIIYGNKLNKRDSELEEFKSFQMIRECPEDDAIIRGRVIWVLNRFIVKPIEKPKE